MSTSRERAGPLTDLKIVEFAGIGPAPFAAMLLADLGADMLRIDRAEAAGAPPGPLCRGRRSVVLDLKSREGVDAALSLIGRADAVIEGFRPGVMERLGLGPDETLARHPGLVYARMTGWGQHGPLAQAAGHDINYIALSGALHAIGTPEAPVAPLNLVGDFGGGALYLAMGLLAGVLDARRTGQGQVVDCSMVEGSASLMGLFYDFHARGRWAERGANLLDGAAPFYNPYRCADGKWISVGAIEPQFYALLLEKIGWAARADLPPQNDRSHWPQTKAQLAALFATRRRDEWCTLLEGSDVCFAPVLDFDEAARHPHNVARQSFVELDGRVVPGPAPRFSKTPGRLGSTAAFIGQDTDAALNAWGRDRPAASEEQA